MISTQRDQKDHDQLVSFGGQNDEKWPSLDRHRQTHAMPTLFLDFDGVLHPEFCHESRHFCCLPVLEEVVRQVPDCELVITSTWRLQQPFERLRERFSPDVATKVVGGTPKISDLVNVPQPLVSYERGGMSCLAAGP